VFDQAKKRAASMLEASPEDLIIERGVFRVVGVPGMGVSLAEVAAAAALENVQLEEEEFYSPGAQTFPNGVYAAVVEVNPDTGEVQILRLVAVDDCGNVLNPMIVEGQTQGSLVQGLGQAMYEEVRYDDGGQLQSATLMDYSIPHATDIPPLVFGRVFTPAPSNPLGVKGSGEAGCIGAPPAIVNAVLDALRPLGVTHIDMPLKPFNVWQAIESAGHRPI
jgi:carbon-monoxide dehydrogenase large subunit